MLHCLSAAGPLLVHCWSTAGPLQVLCWSTVGPLLAHCRSSAGPLLVHCWPTAGPPGPLYSVQYTFVIYKNNKFKFYRHGRILFPASTNSLCVCVSVCISSHVVWYLNEETKVSTENLLYLNPWQGKKFQCYVFTCWFLWPCVKNIFNQSSAESESVLIERLYV